MAIYYLSDLHLCHKRLALRRGFSTVEGHDRIILDNIRNRLSPNDTLYLLGDVFAYNYDSLILLELHQAAPHIVLIRGNHESHWLHKANARLLSRTFSDIYDTQAVTDGDHRVLLSHQPIPSLYEEDAENTYCLYGHLHDQPPRREDWKALCAKPRALNVSIEIGAYTSGRWGEPATLDQWIFFNEVWKSKTPGI